MIGTAWTSLNNVMICDGQSCCLTKIHATLVISLIFAKAHPLMNGLSWRNNNKYKYIYKCQNKHVVLNAVLYMVRPPFSRSEDVAFKIVNREWNLSHKPLGRWSKNSLPSCCFLQSRAVRFGFRVVFDRGVLQLYFNVKRWRYRRWEANLRATVQRGLSKWREKNGGGKLRARWV